MRLPKHVHEAHPWVIAQIAPDFTLLDAWEVPAEGGRVDFEAFVDVFTTLDLARAESVPARALFALRARLGRCLGWDDSEEVAHRRPIPGRAETTLASGLPPRLRGTAPRVAFAVEYGLTPLYRTADEWAAEVSNATVHGVIQLAWIDQGAGRYRGRLAVYVKPRGALGRAYLEVIRPFRHLIVYPAILRQIGRAWEEAARQNRAVTAA